MKRDGSRLDSAHGEDACYWVPTAQHNASPARARWQQKLWSAGPVYFGLTDA
jgi:hypothetical protein